MLSNTSAWQQLIDNASAAPSTCAYTPANSPDPLDVNFAPFPGVSNRDATMVIHAALPVDCSGLRVGRNTSSSTPFDDLHAVTVEPGRTYRVSVKTTVRYDTSVSNPTLDLHLYNPKPGATQQTLLSDASSPVNDGVFTVDAYTDTMIVGVRGDCGNKVCAYDLQIEAVSPSLENVSVRQLQTFEPTDGLTAVGGEVMCTAGLNGVGVACQHHEQVRGLSLSTSLANTPLLWINETDARMRSLSVGEATACAVLNGSLACWGEEASGGLGDGGNTVSSSSTPVSVSLPMGWVPVEVAVSDHDERACALVRNATDARLVHCWGSDADGGLGDGGTFDGSEASPATAVQHENADGDRYADSFELDRQPWDVAELVGHADFPCVRSHEGLVKCWVHPSLGRVYDAPNEMGANLPFVDLGTEVYATQLTQIQLRSSNQPSATCALLENGTVTCWGQSIGSGVASSFDGYATASPGYVTATGDDRVVIGHGTSAGVLSDAVAIAQNCALLSNGTVRCWDIRGNQPHREIDLGGATIVGLFEGLHTDNSYAYLNVCALHETLSQATCFSTFTDSSSAYNRAGGVREVRVGAGLHDVLTRTTGPYWDASTDREVITLQGALTLTEDGTALEAPPLKPGSLAFNRHDTAEVCGIGPDSLPFCVDEAFNTVDFGGRIHQMDKSCFLRTDAEVVCIGDAALLGQGGTGQSTSTPGESLRYGTVDLDLQNHDTDGDGTKDLWDTDDDDDGVEDWDDAFPTDPCASEDTDLDGHPNALVSGCSTPLAEDADDDNDGWSDTDEAMCGTDSTLNTKLPRDTDGDGTCDANDTDLDGDGWSNDDERACAPDQMVVRDLASFDGKHGLGSMFMGGAHQSTPMLLAGEASDDAVYLLDLTASDPFTTVQPVHTDADGYNSMGGRVSSAGDHLGVTLYYGSGTDYVAMTYDSNGTYAPTLFTRTASNPIDPFAPYLEVDGHLMLRGRETLQAIDEPSISAPTVPYPVTVLRLPDGGLLTVGSPSEPRYDGVGSNQRHTTQLPRLQTWNVTHSEWDDPTSLSLQGGSFGNNPRAAAKAVLDDNGTVHLVYPARGWSNNNYYQYVVLNATGLHLIGEITNVLSHNTFSSSSFGLDSTPEGGVRLSYAMSNRSVALVELNISGSHTTTVLPGGPLDSNWNVASVGHVTNAAGQSTVVVIPESGSVQNHDAPLRIFEPVLRFDPATNPAWEPQDTNNAGTCDASTGAMLHFGSEDLLFEVDRFSSEAPLAFGAHEVTGVTAISGLPAGLSVNSSTGAISGTPMTAVPGGVNVTLRITSNGTTTDVVVRMIINEPVLVNAPPTWKQMSHDLESVPWFVTSADGRTYTLNRGGSGTDSFGNAYDGSDLVLTAYHPGGSDTVNWTTRIESYSVTSGIDLAVNPQGEPLVLFKATQSNNHNEDNNVHLSQEADTLGVEGVCDTPDNATHRCTGSGNNNHRLVLVAYGLDGQVNWTQAQQYPAVNRSVTYLPDTTWGDGVAKSEALSIGADGSITVAVPFKSNAGYYRNHNTPTHPYPLGSFGGHEIEVLGSRSSSTDNRFMMLAQLSAEGEVNWVQTTETPDTTSTNQQRFIDVQLDRTSDGGVLLSYRGWGHHAWDDLVLPRLSSSSSSFYASDDNIPNHYMVMFDADGTPLWYQHDGVTRNRLLPYAQLVLDDDTIAIVVSTAFYDGFYHDVGVTNTTSGRPAMSDSDFTADAAYGTVAYNSTSLPGDVLNMFVFRASDGALMGVHSLDSNITVREGFETTGMGPEPNIRAVEDGDMFHLFALSDIPGSEHRLDHQTVNGSGVVISSMATPDVAYQIKTHLGRLRLDAAGLPVLQLERPYLAGGSNDQPIDPYAVTWYTSDGRTVAGALTDMVRFASAQGHMIERNMPRADQSAPDPMYPDLANPHDLYRVWSGSCNGGGMGAVWSLVALNGSTWLPSGFTFNANCGKLSFSGTMSSMNVTPYWLNLSVDGRTFSHQVMVGVAPDAPTLTLPANATFTRGLSGNVFPTDLNGTGLQAARILPALPDGLTLLANGSITGTPTINLTTTSYSVELCNDWNLCVTERISLQINEPLANLTYGGNNSLWLPRDSQVDITPVNTGGAVASFSLNGTLPLGMYFDTETGRIYGNAYLLQNTSSVNITANNSGGTFTVEVNITIPGTGITLAFPAESLSLTNGTTMQNFGGQTSGETPASWSVSPALPSGLAIGSTNGTVYGTPTVEASAADYTVTVTSTSGATAIFVLNIEVLAPVEAIELTLSTASLTLTNNTTMQPFTGQTSGDAPASWTISPNLTGGLQFGTTNGTLWGTPNATSPAVSYVITVYTAGGANDSESVTIAVVAPTISLDYPAPSLSLTNGTTMQSFGAQTTGAAAASYSVSPLLPAGLSLGASNGTLYGTPTLASTAAEYTVTVTSVAGTTDTFALSIEVLDPVESITLTLPAASLSLSNNTTMQPFTGQTTGDAPSTWTISPNLTGGLQFGTGNGTLWGTPNVTSSAVTYTITVFTAGGANDSATVTIAVVAPAITLQYPATSLSLVNGTTMQSFGGQTSGAAALSFSVSPALPNGLSLGASNGTIFGTPTATASPTDHTVTVTSVAGTTATFVVNIEVIEPTESITLTLPAASLSLSNNTTMQPFTGQTTGDAPSTWTISPNLTSGLQFGTSNGTLWGTPNATSSTVAYTITVYTVSGANDSAVVTVSVVAPPITLQYPATNLSLVNGTTMQNFGGQTSGAAASSFSVSPALPSGLSLGASNGTVFGTPTVAASPTHHTFTVTSVAGTTATFVVNIEVLEPVESITLTLPATTLNLVNNSTMQPFTGQTTGDAPSTWTISPNLTAGLQFGTSNGTLWGTPTNASGPVDYTITVYTVSGANDSATFTVEVGPDFDGDGLPDHVDPDDDNDGLPDVDEPAGCRLNPDCDDDGYLDGIDAFPVDPTEWIDTDGDGIGNNADDDDDGDGWNETMETECGNHSDLDAFDRPSDLDGDGICDALDDVDDRPIYLSLREESLVLTVNATMTPLEVSRFGSDVRNWTVTPDLPAGLMLDDNGRITGTPTELSNLTVYTINASNDLHWATVNLSITVQEALPDFDSDGIPDEVDPDDDNDGFSDMTEEACGSDGRNASSVPSDIDGDDLCGAMDPDMDGDGLPNANETNTGVWNGSNNTGTDPANPDTDGDGYCDGPLTVFVGNALFCVGGPDPDPHDPTMPADTDGDGLVDELPDGYRGLLMVDDDDDNDGFGDALEAECGSDGANSTSIPSDMDGDRLCDNIDPDSDGDGLSNLVESELGTSNLSADTDGDGYCDGPVSPPYDDCLPGPDAFPLDPAAHLDTDGDGLPDDLIGTSTSAPMLVEDLDDDGDNWSDYDEFQCGTNSKDRTDVPLDSNDDGTCDALDTVHDLSFVFEYPTEIVDLKVDEAMMPFVPFVNGSGEVLTWELVGDLPEGLMFGESMGRQANANGAISGTPTSLTPETLFVVVWANNTGYAQAFNLSFTVYADDDNDSLPDDLPDNYPGTLRLDTDDDNDGYDDSMELTCGSNPDDPDSDPFNEDASICTGASQVIDTEEGINWMLCFPCLLLLLALFLLLLLIGRDRFVVLEVGPEPENTELDPEVKTGTGTLEDPFVLKPLTGVKPGDVVLSKEIVTVSNMTVESVFLMDLDESVNQRRFHMVDERNSDESLRVVPVSEEGEIEVRFRFDDSMVPTLTGGTYTGLLKLGKASVYLKWTVTVEADPKALKAAEAETEAKRLAAKEAAAQRKAKEKADAKAAAAAEKAQAKAEAKAATALKKAEEEAAAAKAKAEAELAEAKAEAEREIAEAKSKAAAEAQAMKAQAEAEAAEKKAAEAAAAAEAKAKAEQEIAAVKAKAEAEAAELKAKAEADAEAAEAERRRQAEAEAAERQAKMEAELEERRKRLADLDDKARKKEEELIRVAEKSKTIDFGTLGVAASTGLTEDAAKGADTLVVEDASKFEEQGEAYIADAEGGLRIAWTGKEGSSLIGVTGLKRAFAALATVTVADDLQRIKGIGPFIEDKLHALGIYTFRQVGNMTPELEETVNVAIEFFSGRIKRDEWARQAREFEDAKDD